MLPIGKGKSVILVYGQELGDKDKSPFMKWLRMNFHGVKVGGWFTVPWIYVNIEDHSYCFGRPGIAVTAVLNDHAVTIPEFYKILEEYNRNPVNFDSSEVVKNIYSKYEGKAVFVFNKERFDVDEPPYDQLTEYFIPMADGPGSEPSYIPRKMNIGDQGTAGT